jgi:hypothetical protein
MQPQPARQPVQALGDGSAAVPASGRVPASALIPGSMPSSRIAAGKDLPPDTRWPSVSAQRMTPLMPRHSPGVVTSISR